VITIDSEELEETLFYISNHLGETEKSALAQIRRIIQVVGPDKALAFLRQAREVERNGGLKTKAGKKRTIGGVYFHLVKEGCDEATVKRLFPPKDWKAFKSRKQVQVA
jgi:hypothetical protein